MKVKKLPQPDIWDVKCMGKKPDNIGRRFIVQVAIFNYIFSVPYEDIGKDKDKYFNYNLN